MSRIGYVFLLCAMAMVALVGCSGDDSSPTAVGMNFSSYQGKAIGPSEIVFCIDVSDSLTQDELAANLDALSAALANGDLLPADGSVAVAALVYGDTTAAALAALTAVTPENLTNVILPAIAGLKTDRLVGTAGADLTGALDTAAGLLAPRNVNDQHVLILGSGFADDTAAAAAACGSLAAAGVMASAVAAGGDETSAADLAGCAAAGGGYFADGAADLQLAIDHALAYMLQVGLTVTPAGVELARGQEHTVTGVLSRGGAFLAAPIQGADVTFAIIDGPNQAEAVAVATDTLGTATFTYTGDGGAGLDRIVVSAVHPGTGEALSDTVTAAWLNAAPTCDAGGPYTATATGDTAMVTLDASASADADGDTLTYLWAIAFEGASLDDPTAATPVLTLTGDGLCVDTLLVDLTVSDGIDTSTCQAQVVLDDVRAPLVEVRDEPISLWSPNHKYHAITPEMVFTRVEDACGNVVDLSQIVVTGVTSDEPEDHNGDGKTMDDIMIHCPATVSLRAERMGGGDGRVYTISYRVTGENGAQTDVDFQVVVPHDSSGRAAVDSGEAGYGVVAGCGEED